MAGQKKSPWKTSDRPTRRHTKDRFLAVAEEVFAQKGFKGATTREIADRVGVNISSLHFHWHSKENLYLEVLRKNALELGEVVSRWGPNPSEKGHGAGRSQVEMIRAFLGELVDFSIRSRNFVRIMVHRWLEQDRAYNDVEERMMAPLANMVSSRLAHVMPEGLDEEIDPDHLTINFLWVIIGYVIGGPLHRLIIEGDIESPETRETVKAHVTRVALRILGLNP